MYPHNTSIILNYLYPNASENDYVVGYDGQETKIQWNLDSPKPTAEEIIAAGNSQGFQDHLFNLDIKKQIAALESHITPRRIREAVLGIDNGWLSNTNAQIATLRGTLK